MDPNLTCIDPNLLQLSQLLEEDEEVPPPIRVPSSADDGAGGGGGGGKKTTPAGWKERIDDAASETVAAFSGARKRLAEEDAPSSNTAAVPEEKKPRFEVEEEKLEDLREKGTFCCSRLLTFNPSFALTFSSLNGSCVFGNGFERCVECKQVPFALIQTYRGICRQSHRGAGKDYRAREQFRGSIPAAQESQKLWPIGLAKCASKEEGELI